MHKRASSSLLLPWLCLCVSLSCNDRGGDGTGDGGTDVGGVRLMSLDVKPINDVLLVDLNTEQIKPFTVRGYFSDGSNTDMTHRVKWTLDNSMTGRFIGNQFHSATLNQNKVDFTRVIAQYKDASSMINGVANLTVVWLRQSGDSQDFFFNLPYKAAAQSKPLTFSTEVQSLDVFFDVDTTGSMGGEITELTRSLQTTVIPGVKAAAAKDAWFGVGAQDDWPIDPYGNGNCNGGPDDQPLVLIQEMTDDVGKAQTAVGELLKNGHTRGCGNDTPEGHMESYYQVATGEGQTVVANIPANHKGIGGVAFRDGALPVLVGISDAAAHTINEPGKTCFGQPLDYSGQVATVGHNRQQVKDAMNKICAKFVGITAITMSEEGCLATNDMIDFSTSTGALVPPEAWDVGMRPNGCAAGKCCTGQLGAGEEPNKEGLCPLVFKITPQGTGIGDQVTSGISQLARFANFDVVASTVGQAMGTKGETLPPNKTSADFIKSIIPLDALPPMPPPVIASPEIAGDHFTHVTPGSFLRFTIEAVNDLIKETTKPQVFHATIRVRAGGCANLDARDVIILIPPSNPTPM